MTSRRLLAAVLLLAAAASFAETRPLLDEFQFQGRAYRLSASFSPGRADLHLQGGAAGNLSAGMGGENILLGVRAGADDFYVFWLNYRPQAVGLAYYDHRLDRSRLVPLPGFTFIGAPEIIEENGALRGLVFLGNRSRNDDVFHLDLEEDALTALTATPFSEKEFSLRRQDGWIEIAARSLGRQRRYRFDPLRRTTVLLEESRVPARRRTAAAAAGPGYANTYIGFGDSITWGEIEGRQQLGSCYLSRMRDLLADPGYADYYGASSFVNLGVPGDDTWDGAQRIDEELASHSGLYFLLMLGVNDAIRTSLSVDSSLENLAYIIDAAKARGLRVIASTLTPSKANFSNYAYYWKNLNELSAGILALARAKGVASIDPLTAFMGTDPPDGWKDLLENIIPHVSSGNHPNAAGHRLIASLFAPALVAFPPQAPQNIAVADPQNPLQRTASWDPNYESDFDHFHVEFGFQEGALNYALDAAASYCTFHLFPFLPRLYFRVQAVDRGGHGSGFSSTGAEAAAVPSPVWNRRARADSGAGK